MIKAITIMEHDKIIEYKGYINGECIIDNCDDLKYFCYIMVKWGAASVRHVLDALEVEDITEYRDEKEYTGPDRNPDIYG